MLPTLSEIEALHRKHAPTQELFDLIYTHCQIVWAIAEQAMARQAFVGDADLVRVGCLLHDIGVYRLYNPAEGRHDAVSVTKSPLYVTHGYHGYQLLKSEGLDETICRFASHHTGVGLSKDDIAQQHIAMPAADYLATTPEERLIMYADKFHTKDTPPVFNKPQTYRAFVGKYGADKQLRFDALLREFGQPDLEALSRTYGYKIR